MAKTVEELLTENNDMLRSVLAGSGRGSTVGTSSPSGGSTGMPGWVNTIGTGMSNALGATTKFASGLYGVNDALTNINQLGGAIGPVGKLVTTMGTQVLEAGITVNRSLNTVAQSGVHLGQNLGLYEQAVLQARMSLPEFEQTIRSNSKSIAGLGSNMDKSAMVYLGIAKKIQDTDIAYQLKATGTNTEEFGQVLALVAHNAKQDDMMTAASQKSLIATTLALTTEFDNTARLTGISRQEQQKALDSQIKSKDMQLAMMAMDKDEREAVQKSLAGSLKYGEAVQNAIKVYATGGVTNAEEQKTVLAAGPLAQFAEQLAAIKGTSAEDERRRADIYKQMDQVSKDLASTTGEDKKMWAVQAKSGNETTKAMAGGVLEISRYGQILRQAEKEGIREGKDLEAYIASERAKIEAERLGAQAGTGGPEGNAAKLGQSINKFDTLIKDITAGAGTHFSGLNKKVGETITEMGNLNTVLRKFTPEQAAGIPGKVLDNAKANLGVREGALPPAEKKQGRQDGSLGAVGKLIEDFGAGTDMILHGREGVVTEKQLKGIISTAQQMGRDLDGSKDKRPNDLAQLTSIFSGMQPTMEKEMSKMQKQFEPLFNQFKSTASTMGKQMETQVSPILTKMHGSLKSDLEKAKAQVPTTSTFEKMFDQVKSVQPTPIAAPANPDAFVGNAMPEDAMTEVAKGVNELNKRIERLIFAVEDGHSKSVKAIKNTGNLIA